MKKIIIITLLAAASPLMAKENIDQRRRALMTAEFAEARKSNPIETFADAIEDPNVVIGVFESDWPRPSRLISAPGRIRNVLLGFKPVELIKGQLKEEWIWVPRPSVARPPVPMLIAPRGSKWILALRKTTPEYRIVRFGEEIEEYEFLNDDTLFILHRLGHGALCLEWPEDIEQPDWVVKVSEDIIDDFKVIQELTTELKESRLDPSDAVDMTKLLETEHAKSIFAEIIRHEKSLRTEDCSQKD